MRRTAVAGTVGVLLFVFGLGAGYVLFHDSTSDRRLTNSREVGVPVGCRVSNPDTVAVPDVRGNPLPDAIAEVKASGLQVINSGVVIGDPSGSSAIVVAQEPPAGIRVPAGACIGFRTRG